MLQFVLDVAGRSLGFVPRASALALLALGCGAPPLEPRDPTPGVPHFTIATYNILGDSQGDVATRETIGETRADIICLEEVTAEWERVIRERYAADYPFMVFYAEGGAGGLGVLSKRRLIEEAFFEEVFVMADDPALRAARLGLLASVRDLGAGLLDWSELRL